MALNIIDLSAVSGREENFTVFLDQLCQRLDLDFASYAMIGPFSGTGCTGSIRSCTRPGEASPRWTGHGSNGMTRSGRCSLPPTISASRRKG